MYVCTYHDHDSPEENTASLVTPSQRDGYLLRSQIFRNRELLDEEICWILAHQDTNVEYRPCSVSEKPPKLKEQLTQPVVLVSIKTSILLDTHDGAESQRSLIKGLAEVRLAVSVPNST